MLVGEAAGGVSFQLPGEERRIDVNGGPVVLDASADMTSVDALALVEPVKTAERHAMDVLGPVPEGYL